MPSLLIDHLLQQFPAAKRVTLKRMVEAGRVTVNGITARRLKHPVGEGEIVRVADQPRGGRKQPLPPAADARLRIVHEDADILVADKPAGLLTSTVPREKRVTLIALIRQHLSATDSAARAGVVHRLDRDASGLLVFSKNDAAYRALKKQFFDHSVERVYTAVVEGVPQPAAKELDSRLVEYSDGSVHSTQRADKGERAITRYEILRHDRKRALLKVTLQTGRKHQIRAQLCERGHPLVGDPVYGPAARQNAKAMALDGGLLLLTATRLALTHPRSGERLAFEVPTPAAMEAAVGLAYPRRKHEAKTPAPQAPADP